MEYEKLFEALHREKIRTLICGGLAVNLYGIPRMTADIDLLVDFEKENLLKLENTLKLLNYFPRVPVPISKLSSEAERNLLVKEKNMIAYSFYNSGANFMTVDVLLDTPVSFFELWAKRDTRKMDNFEVNLVSVEHLIEMKKYSNRKQDNDDVILLSKLIGKK